MGDRQLNVLHVMRAPVGGLFRHVRDLAAAQGERGHRVGVVCDATANDPLTNSRLDELGRSLALGVTRVPMSREIGPSDWTAARCIRQRACELSIDVLHGHGAKGGAFARLGAPRGDGPLVVYTPHGGSLHYHPTSLKGRIYMGLERRLARWTDAIVFESAYSADVFARLVGAPPCATKVIHNGLLGADFVHHRPATDAADFLFVGELRHLKGVDILIEALAQVGRQRAVSAVIVGAGPDGHMFEKLVAERGLSDRVRFAGAMPAAQAFGLARTLVVPSRAESFPYIVLEAVAAGMPLIATDVGGIREITQGAGAPLVAPDDHAALASALGNALDDLERGYRTARTLRAAALSRFTVDAMTDAVLALYTDCRTRRRTAALEALSPANA